MNGQRTDTPNSVSVRDNRVEREIGLKQEINNFLWTHVSGGVSIHQADELAHSILKLIIESDPPEVCEDTSFAERHV